MLFRSFWNISDYFGLVFSKNVKNPGKKSVRKNAKQNSNLALPWQCHGSAMAVPWHCHGTPKGAKWSKKSLDISMKKKYSINNQAMFIHLQRIKSISKKSGKRGFLKKRESLVNTSRSHLFTKTMK